MKFILSGVVLIVVLVFSSCTKYYCAECVAYDALKCDSIVNTNSVCDKSSGYIDGFKEGFTHASDSLGRKSHCVGWVDD